MRLLTEQRFGLAESPRYVDGGVVFTDISGKKLYRWKNEQLEMIWDRYYKVDKVHRRETVGTGLGLSIVKQILELHGATYGVNSTIGEGSIFWFELSRYSVADVEKEQGFIEADYEREKDGK